MSAPRAILAAGGLLWRDGRLAVVHRPRHDDWSIPKGKLEGDESPDAAALREVDEEVGCRARITAYAGRVEYEVNEAPKVVFFWHMEPAGEGSGPSEEVDRVEWLAPEEAVQLLSYEAERELLRRAVRTEGAGGALAAGTDEDAAQRRRARCRGRTG